MSRRPRTAATSRRKFSAINHRTLVGKARRERTRAKIIAAAMQVYAEKGTANVMIDDFIKAAGVARGTFYNYFSTTEELLDATVAWSSDDVIRSIEAEIRNYADPVLRMACGVGLYLQLAERDRAWCAFMTQIPHIGVLARSRIRVDLRNGLASGAFQFDNLEAALDLVIGPVLQLLRRIGTGNQRRYPTQALISAILIGLGTAPSDVARVLATPLPQMHRLVKSEEIFRRKKSS